jgi:peptide/nickel transport system substrate-binding protein
MRITATRRSLAALAAASLLAACTGEAGSESDKGSTGSQGQSTQILRIGSTDEVDSLNPFVGLNSLSYSTWQISYPYLVMYGENLEFVPSFATDWSASADGKEWTFHTVPDATWSDGEPRDAEDVAWSFNTMVKYQDKAAGNWASTVAHLNKVTATDENTVVFSYGSPVANVLPQLQQVPILPEQFWGEYAASGELKTVEMTTPVISGGPFIVQSYDKNASAALKANPEFWGTPPKVAGISLTMFKDDDAMIAALRNHEIDLIETLPPSGVEPLEEAGFAVDQAPSPSLSDLIFNSNPMKPKNRELLDPRVREAFASAFDLQQMVDTVWLGTAVLGNSIVPPATGKWSDSSLHATAYDPAHANEILDGLGYKPGPDGIRVADGHRMSYEVIMPDLALGDRMFAMIRDWLKAVKIEVIQKRVDDSTAFELVTAPDGKYLDFDLAMWTWGMLPDPDFALSVMLCSQYGSWNDTGYCNPRYDELYQEQGTELNEAKRLEIIYRMQQMLAADRPYIFLGYKNHITAYDKSWSGFQKTMYGPYNALASTSMIGAHKG